MSTSMYYYVQSALHDVKYSLHDHSTLYLYCKYMYIASQQSILQCHHADFFLRCLCILTALCLGINTCGQFSSCMYSILYGVGWTVHIRYFRYVELSFFAMLRVICQFYILRGVNIFYRLCKIALWGQFGLNSGGFKWPASQGAYVPSIKFADFCRKRFLRKLNMSVIHLPLFSSFKICKYRVCVFIYLFIFVCLFICQENVWYVSSIPLLRRRGWVQVL